MCVNEAIYVGPHRLLANTQRGSPSLPPPLQGAEEEIGCSARLPGQYCSLPKSEFCDLLKALVQNTKTTFLKYRFLMIKHCLNTVKHRLLVEKDRGNACRKNQEKKTSRFFLANFF